MANTHVRIAVAADGDQLSRLRGALWPESSAEELRKELTPILAGKPSGAMPLVVFVAEATGGRVVGFLEVGLRSHADGCDTSRPVGFIEGWFVAEDHREHGIGAQLMTAAEDWARSLGCIEMASDALQDSHLSQKVHEALKFEVVDRCVHYRKSL